MTLAAKISRLFCANHVKVVGTPYTVEESDPLGQAWVDCFVPSGVTAIALERQQDWRELHRTPKHADSALLLVDETEYKAELVVVECKKTLSAGTLTTAREQLWWSTHRAEMIAASLGLQISKRRWYLAYQSDKLGVHQNPSPMLLRSSGSANGPATPPPAHEWASGAARILMIQAAPIPWGGVQLDSEGRGSLSL